MDLNKRLREHTGLTPTDQCLRDYFLRYPERVARMNTRQLAEATFTSPSAVVRFCRKFGYQGLQDFKADYFSAIPDALAFDLPDSDFPFQADTPPDVLVRDLLKLEAGTLHRLSASLDFDAFDRAAALLSGASSIELCAAGSGLYLLEEFAFRLMKFGFRINMISNSVNLSYIANQMDSTHCLLVVSYTGMNESIGSAMRFARQHGTPILLITAHADSPAARLSDCVLLLPLLESNDNKISTFSSSIAAKAMLDLLFARLFQNDYDANCDFVRRDAARLSVRRPSASAEGCLFSFRLLCGSASRPAAG